MKIDPHVVSRVSVLPVSLEIAKQHLRVDFSDDDGLITGMIEAASDYAEQFMGRTLVDTTYDLVLDAFPSRNRPLALPRPPLIQFVGAYVMGADDIETELTGVVADTASARLLAPAAGWPTGTTEASIRIRYRAGYVALDAAASPPATVGVIPSAILAALRLYLGSLYQQREDQTPSTMTPLPWNAECLLRMYRLELGAA